MNTYHVSSWVVISIHVYAANHIIHLATVSSIWSGSDHQVVGKCKPLRIPSFNAVLETVCKDRVLYGHVNRTIKAKTHLSSIPDGRARN